MCDGVTLTKGAQHEQPRDFPRLSRAELVTQRALLDAFMVMYWSRDLQADAGNDICRLVEFSDLRRSMSEVDHGVYARATTPAIDPAVHNVSVEDAAQARVSRILTASGGELQYNISQVYSEILQAERNEANGYPDGRLPTLRRVVDILRSRGY
jgi:hypothetical protein